MGCVPVKVQEGCRRAVGCCFIGGGAGLLLVVVVTAEVRETAAGRAVDMIVWKGK